MPASTLGLAIKAIIATTTDKQTRTAVLSVLAAILMPFILIVSVLLCAVSGTAHHNHTAVDFLFHSQDSSFEVPMEYQRHMETMRECFFKLDYALEEVNGMTQGETVDMHRVKSVFYALFFGNNSSEMQDKDYRLFVDCFVTYQEEKDETGNEKRIAVPIAEFDSIYANIETMLHRKITLEDKRNVVRIYTQGKYGQKGIGGSGLPPGIPIGDGKFQTLMEEATKYIGWPYVWGGSSPSTSFDCSGYVCWVYTKSGVYHLPRTTAQGIFDQCAVVSRKQAKPGDLVFFTGTYASASPVSHIGIYVGENQMLHCGNPIGYANLDSPYWSSHFYAIGRLPN